MNPNRTNVGIIIVNYRTAELTIDCLRSLESEVSTVTQTRVVVVDNASGDDSVARIHSAIEQNGWSNWATLVAAERNGGFAYGNNIGIKLLRDSISPPQYYWLLNSDTQVYRGALRSLLDFLAQNPRVGIVGSRLEERDGGVQTSAFRFPSPTSEFLAGMRLGILDRMLPQKVVAPRPSEVAHRTDWVSGASMLIRSELVDDIGLLDEGYFLYFEEVDYCVRAAKAGWETWYVPASRVVHLVGQSTQITAPRRRPRYWFDSRARFFKKTYGGAFATIADLLWLLGYSIFRCRAFVQRKRVVDPPWLLHDFASHAFLTRLRRS